MVPFIPDSERGGGGYRIIRPSSGGRDAPLEGRGRQKALWGSAEACRGGLLLMLFPPVISPVRLSGYHMVLPWAPARWNLSSHRFANSCCTAQRSGKMHSCCCCFPCFHPSHLSCCFFSLPPTHPHPFCSLLSSRTMRTLSMRSRPAARRPARKK